MFCGKCGAELEPHENFCPFCGEKVLKSQSTEPVQQSRSTEPTIEPQPVAPIYKVKRSSAGKKIGIVVGVIVVVAALIFGAYLISQSNTDDKEPFLSSENTGNANDTGEPNGTVSTTPEPEASPDNTLIAEEPTTSPDTPSTSSVPTTTEPTVSNSATVDLSSLYIGMWIAKGQSEGDMQNGWTALCVDAVTGDSVTFRLEKIQAAPANRIADTYPITVTLENGAAIFPVSDSWGNSGTGEITIQDDIIHVRVDITNPDPASMWDISMDTEFYPEIGLTESNHTSTELVGLGVTEESITQEFKKLGGASFSVENTMFVAGVDSAMFQFDFGENTANFGYYYDRSSGEISIGDVSNWAKVDELANAAFVVLSGNDGGTGLKGFASKIYDTESSERSSYYDEAEATEHGNFYVETVTNAYTGVHTVDGYECTFWLYHSYDAMQSGRSGDVYGGNIKFNKSEG